MRDGDPQAEAASLLETAAILAEMGELDRSVTAARRARTLFLGLGDSIHEARALLLCGLGLLALDRGDEGIEEVAEAALLVDGQDAASPALASAYSAVAGAYAEMEAFEIAHDYDLRAIEIATAVGGVGLDRARQRMAADLAAWGERLAQAGHATEAAERFRLGLDLAEACTDGDDDITRTVSRLTVGECRLGLGDADGALGPLRDAFERSREEPRLRARAALRMGLALTAARRHESARRFLEEAFALAERNGLLRLRCEIHRARATLCEMSGDLRAAIVEHHAVALATAQRSEVERRRRLDSVRARVRLAKAQRETLELARLSFEDPLTGLHNRRFAQAELPRLVDAARASGKPLAVALIDVDHFKLINDRVSHAAGDAVLRRVAELLRTHCRDGDLVVRYGGDEFLVAFPGLEAQDAGRIAERLRTAVAAEEWSQTTPGGRVTLSIGVTHADELSDPAGLIDAADVRLYAAKRAGRNRVRLAA